VVFKVKGEKLDQEVSEDLVVVGEVMVFQGRKVVVINFNFE
jgi:hypothetical protein